MILDTSMQTDGTRARSAETVEQSEMVAAGLDYLDAVIESDALVLDARSARIVAAVLSRVITALRAGAASARSYDGQDLTYADGWSSAATLAAVESADALRAALAAETT